MRPPNNESQKPIQGNSQHQFIHFAIDSQFRVNGVERQFKPRLRNSEFVNVWEISNQRVSKRTWGLLRPSPSTLQQICNHMWALLSTISSPEAMIPQYRFAMNPLIARLTWDYEDRCGLLNIFDQDSGARLGSWRLGEFWEGQGGLGTSPTFLTS